MSGRSGKKFINLDISEDLENGIEDSDESESEKS
jgi:hypothetical protein